MDELTRLQMQVRTQAEEIHQLRADFAKLRLQMLKATVGEAMAREILRLDIAKALTLNRS